MVRMIRVMRLWKNGDMTSIGLFASLCWALHAFRRAEQKGIWIEDEKKPATLKGHS